MSFQDAMNAMLPPICSDGKTVEPHKTSGYGGWRPKTGTYHNAIDFNYVGGQAAAHNKDHPSVSSPVSGTVVPVPGRDKDGAVHIKDKDGNIHKILHLDCRSVKAGDEIKAGEALGTMGGRGPKGPNHHPQHVHYAIEDKNGKSINPETFWKDRKIEKAADKKAELDRDTPVALSAREQMVAGFGLIYGGIPTLPFITVTTPDALRKAGVVIPPGTPELKIAVSDGVAARDIAVHHLGQFNWQDKDLAATQRTLETNFVAAINSEAKTQGVLSPFTEHKRSQDGDRAYS